MEVSVIEKKLTQKDIPITPMRMIVLDALMKSSQAISLSEFEELLQQSDRSTIYRTLKTFEKKGLIHSIQENNTTQYLMCHDDCDESQHHDYHLHFYCTQCKKTTCLEEVRFESIHFPENYLIKELKFVANGICKDCQK
ncbi:Fur family transcriptional regulator [Chryseobacterium sp. RR2-3-20]|uniref:Fur family transcriptional regulator n=1 Tax=Chryseobacterium sp. RR2-3-20 TaxID=2787626 RepID=UPI001FD7C007|nr:transcriptional repressor [Chryseobacterium sp. RR2-3-20]